jgi:hypothetical protein
LPHAGHLEEGADRARHNQHRAWGEPDQTLGDAAVQQPESGSVAAPPGHDQVGITLARNVNDHVCEIPGRCDEFEFRPHPGVTQFLDLPAGYRFQVFLASVQRMDTQMTPDQFVDVHDNEACARGSSKRPCRG